MKITTIRLPEGMAVDLEKEAEENDMSLSEYVRRILRDRDRIRQENTSEYDERIQAVEQRLDELEKMLSDDREDKDLDDWLEWIRDNQPVSREEILEHCVPKDYHGKPSSWWRRHGKEELKDAGGEFTRNQGWRIV